MITKLGQVMLYVKDQEKSAVFWSKSMGFSVRTRYDSGTGMKWIEVAPTPDSATTLVLHNKEVVSKMAPEVNLGSPSLLFFTDSADSLWEELKARGVQVGQIVQRPDGKVFNFADNEGNYFAVLER